MMYLKLVAIFTSLLEHSRKLQMFSNLYSTPYRLKTADLSKRFPSEESKTFSFALPCNLE